MIAAIWVCAYVAAGVLVVGLAERWWSGPKGASTGALVVLVLLWPLVSTAFALMCFPELLAAAVRRISGHRAP
jgi:hypothetical protein